MENGEGMLNKMNVYWLVVKEGTDAVIKELKE